MGFDQLSSGLWSTSHSYGSTIHFTLPCAGWHPCRPAAPTTSQESGRKSSSRFFVWLFNAHTWQTISSVVCYLSSSSITYLTIQTVCIKPVMLGNVTCLLFPWGSLWNKWTDLWDDLKMNFLAQHSIVLLLFLPLDSSIPADNAIQRWTFQ